MKDKQTDIKILLAWVREAQTAHQEWRKDSWKDFEFRDGKQWSASDIAKLKKKNIKAITINRIFPILNLIQGHYLNNRQDLVAKGRTKKDNELGQVMSEGLQYVLDQNRGHFRMARAFNQQITAGFGCLSLGFNPDPRKEKIALYSHDWFSTWWDPYATPWMDKEECRYAFTAKWSDLENLIELFPEFRSDLTEQFNNYTSDVQNMSIYDEGTMVEEYKYYLSAGQWADKERKRVRPVEMYYPKSVKRWFACLPNGRVIDLDSLTDTHAQYELIEASREVVSATVKKMRSAIFLGDLLLQDQWSPYVHDEYPYIPFVGYLDRFDFPFGVPRQVIEQDMEVNKRRTMALALLNSRRVKIETGAAENENKAYAEANRTDGFIVLKPGKMKAFEIQEMSDLAPAQIDLLKQSEQEIQEISGANDESLGYSPRVQSGVALDKKQQTTATITASLLENAKYSQQMLGNRACALMQDTWKEEKILRITDRVTGMEKFVAINQMVMNHGAIELKNDIAQAMFDIVITARPMTATVREKNSDLIFSAINKAPPEAIGPLLNLALEISDLPNKDLLLQQIRKATGVDRLDDDLSLEEREQIQKDEAEARIQEQNKQKQQEDIIINLEQDKIKAETEKLRAEAQATRQDVDQKGWEAGSRVAQEMRKGETQNDGARGKSL